MDKIVLKHTRIEINNYNPGDCPGLEKNFSIYDPIHHKVYIKAVEYDPETKQLRIPRGIDIDYIRNMFMDDPVIDTNCDPYTNVEPMSVKYQPRDDRQINIIKFLLGIQQYSYTTSCSQLCCNSTTGSGKTYTTVTAICFAGYRAIIIANLVDWLDQWKERILEYTNIDPKQIYTITGSASINKVLMRDPFKYRIFLASHSTIRSYGDRNGWDKIEEFFKHIQVGLKVYDEAHLYFDNMCKIDFHSNTNKTIYLTATPKRSSKDEDRIYQYYFRNVPSIVLFDEEVDPHVRYYAVHFSSHPSQLEIDGCRSPHYGLDRNKYTNYVSEKPYFKKLMCILIDMVLRMNGKALIYVGTNAAINNLVNYLIEEFPLLEGHVGIYTSIIDPSIKESMLCKKIIFSTTKSCGAAMDISDLICTINLAEPFRSDVLARQTLGRCRMNNSMYVDIVDHGFKSTINYYAAKQPVFSQYAKSCRDVYIDDEEIDKRFSDMQNKYANSKFMFSIIYDR